MTINPIQPRLLWAGSGSTSSITLSVSGEPIVFNNSSELIVQELNVASGDITTLTLGVQYSISGGPVPDSTSTAATLNKISGVLLTGYKWLVLRSTPAAQTTDLAAGGPFASSDVEAMMDRAAVMVQELREVIDRAALINGFDRAAGVSPLLPAPSALGILRWNALATALESVIQADLSGTTVSSYIATLFDDANAAAARTTLGLAALAILNTVGTSQIDNDAVTYAKIQNISATSRILGRRTAAAGDTEECTLSQILDFIGSAAQGDILYRGASSWARLGAGTNLQFLQTPGAGGNPLWASAGATLLATGSASAAATVDIVLTSFTAYRNILIDLQGIIPSVDDTQLFLRTSTNGGSSYDAGASDYSYAIYAHSAAGSQPTDQSSGAAQIGISVDDATAKLSSDAGATANYTISLPNRTAATKCPVQWAGGHLDSSARVLTEFGTGFRNASADIDAVRFLMAGGSNITLSYAVYGWA